MKELYRFRQFLAEGVIKENIMVSPIIMFGGKKYIEDVISSPDDFGFDKDDAEWVKNNILSSPKMVSIQDYMDLDDKWVKQAQIDTSGGGALDHVVDGLKIHVKQELITPEQEKEAMKVVGLSEGVIKENISSHKEEAKRFLEKFVDDNKDKFEFIPDLETGYIDANDNSYNVDELASIFLDIGQDIPRGTHNQKYKGEGGTYVVVSEGVIKEEQISPDPLYDMGYSAGEKAVMSLSTELFNQPYFDQYADGFIKGFQDNVRASQDYAANYVAEGEFKENTLEYLIDKYGQKMIDFTIKVDQLTGDEVNDIEYLEDRIKTHLEEPAIRQKYLAEFRKVIQNKLN